jgi:hypothetical protein
MTIQIRDLSVSKEIDQTEMSAVRGGLDLGGKCYGSLSVSEFASLVKEGALNNPVDLIQAASVVKV